MKKMTVVVFLMAIMLTGCGEPKVTETTSNSAHPTLYTFDEWKDVSNFEDTTTTFEESEVRASKEYWETLEYNSRKNEW